MVSEADIKRTIQAGDVEGAKLLLLQYPYDANKAGHWQECARLCVENNHLELLKFMLERGLDINIVGYNLLATAIQFSNEELAKFFVEKGAKTNHQPGTNLFHVACNKGSVDLAEFMLKKGSDVSSRIKASYEDLRIRVKNENLFPLQIAARNAHFLDTSKFVHLAKLLLAHGADIKELEELDYGGTLKRQLKEMEELSTVTILS
ncbi:ankyrin repeat-containing domain protein [Paraphysoderma sedebokerense]|nr:ankyrin repeat-containing domain protein [Paraphysoderma sedebokerense]